ncbi:hypothetical protein MYG54_003197 [Escherichia coli]|nr:hypothetical protein [Escherichia coli]
MSSKLAQSSIKAMF